MPAKCSLKCFIGVLAAVAVLSAGISVRAAQGGGPAPLESYALTKDKFVLPNGLTVVVVEKHKLPLIHVQLLVKAGVLHEPTEKAGLANLTGNLLDKGTSSKTALEIAEGLDLLGASLSVEASRSATIINLSVLLKDVEEGLGILTEVLTDPAFKEEELGREKTKVLSGLAQKKDKPKSLVQDAIVEMVYQGHAMGRPIEGYDYTVPKVTREDVLDFYRRYYLPGNTILIVVADMSREEMRRLVERRFGSWKGGAVPPPLELSPPHEGIRKKVRLIDKDVNQSYVNLGMLSLKRNNPDYNSLRVMNYIMGGGGFVSRLLKRVRSEEGLAYSAYAYVAPGSIFTGYYLAALETKIDTTSKAMNIMLDVMRGMREEPVTDEELAEAKSFYEGSLARRMETYSDVARLAMDQEFYGLPDNYYLKDIEEINGFTKEDVLRVARKYIDLENYNVAIVTKVKDLRLEVQGISESMIEKAKN